VTAREILVSIALGLAVNEACDISPWCARRIVRWSTRLRYADKERRRVRGDELVALIDERPGKLFKLATALGFLAASLLSWVHRALPGALRQFTQHPSMRDATSFSSDTAIMTVTNFSALPVAALEIGTALSALGTEGRVVMVNGTWGSGKSSLVRVAMSAIDETLTIAYNPWAWWNNHPATHPLQGLAAAIRATDHNLAALVRAWDHYIRQRSSSCGRTWPQILTERRVRRRLAGRLRELSRPLVIVLDDLDRMCPEKARQVFEVVTRTAGLPNLGYLMSFDRTVMERNLPSSLIDECIGKLQVQLMWGTCRSRPI
jgi:hypothetical protein